jgi:hypothetical protein
MNVPGGWPPDVAAPVHPRVSGTLGVGTGSER